MSFAPPDPSSEPGTSELPPPPDRPGESAPTKRVGDLTDSWRALLTAAWVAAFFAYAAVWQASVQIGIATWWVGPRADPNNLAIRLIPFVLAIAIVLLIVYEVAHLVRWSAVGVAAAALVAVPDLSRSLGLGLAELAIAGLLAVVTLSSLAGRYRAATD